MNEAEKRPSRQGFQKELQETRMQVFTLGLSSSNFSRVLILLEHLEIAQSFCKFLSSALSLILRISLSVVLVSRKHAFSSSGSSSLSFSVRDV